jgi:transcriptional regulator
MHPNAAYRSEDRALLAALIDEIGFGMIFAATPDGPRVAHAPLLRTGDGAVQFHLSHGNALTKHLDGTTALAVINGPDGYVSARWYEDQARVPTWDYVSIELEGRVRRMDSDGLLGLLEALSAQHEARIAEGEPWTMAKLPAERQRQLLGAITGFELEIAAWRPTFKLHQTVPAHERERIVAGLEAQGSNALAELIRTFAP